MQPGTYAVELLVPHLHYRYTTHIALCSNLVRCYANSHTCCQVHRDFLTCIILKRICIDAESHTDKLSIFTTLRVLVRRELLSPQSWYWGRVCIVLPDGRLSSTRVLPAKYMLRPNDVVQQGMGLLRGLPWVSKQRCPNPSASVSSSDLRPCLALPRFGNRLVSLRHAFPNKASFERLHLTSSQTSWTQLLSGFNSQ